MKPKRFLTAHSPLQGRVVPLDWGRLDDVAKRRALVKCGYAQSYEAACRMMGQHAAAVKRARREEQDRLERECAESRRRTGE